MRGAPVAAQRDPTAGGGSRAPCRVTHRRRRRHRYRCAPEEWKRVPRRADGDLEGGGVEPAAGILDAEWDGEGEECVDTRLLSLDRANVGGAVEAHCKLVSVRVDVVSIIGVAQRELGEGGWLGVAHAGECGGGIRGGRRGGAAIAQRADDCHARLLLGPTSLVVAHAQRAADGVEGGHDKGELIAPLAAIVGAERGFEGEEAVDKVLAAAPRRAVSRLVESRHNGVAYTVGAVAIVGIDGEHAY